MKKQDANVVFAGSIPENYDRYLGPSFFEPFAKDLVARLPNAPLQSVLELACGTGIVTRQLRKALPAQTRIVATDLNRAMFEFAQKKSQPNENIEWQEADAGALPFAAETFDAAVCQFGLMFVPDKQAAVREAHRVLKRGGVFLFNVWDAIEHHAIARTTHETVATFFASDPPNFYEIPFSFHDEKTIRALLESAGFKNIECETVTLPCRSSSADELSIGLVRGNPIATAIEERGVDIGEVIAAVRQKVAQHFGEAPVESTMRALVWRAEQ